MEGLFLGWQMVFAHSYIPFVLAFLLPYSEIKDLKEAEMTLGSPKSIHPSHKSTGEGSRDHDRNLTFIHDAVTDPPQSQIVAQFVAFEAQIPQQDTQGTARIRGTLSGLPAAITW
jgi:hypothetical protein